MTGHVRGDRRRWQARRAALGGAIALAVGAGSASPMRGERPAEPLRVLRAAPSGESVSPTATITVIFDRPVAPELSATVDPARVLAITPAAQGKAEWRDPVTIRFRPTAPLRPGRRYAVTISDSLRAVDGSRLAAPYRFTFRVRGPTLVGAPLVNGVMNVRYLPPEPTFEVIYTAPVDLSALSAVARLEHLRWCPAGSLPIALLAVSQRPFAPEDTARVPGWSYYIRRTVPRGGEALVRVVRLVPAAAPPPSCDIQLVVPREIGAARQEWPVFQFRTHGNVRVVGVACGHGYDTSCPTGPLRVEFTRPVRGADVLRHVHLSPSVAITVRDTALEAEHWLLDAKLAPRTTYRVTFDSALRDATGQPIEREATFSVTTTGYPPLVAHATGMLVSDRRAPKQLAVTYVNVDRLSVQIVPIPTRLEARFAAPSDWSAAQWTPRLMDSLARGTSSTLRVEAPTDVERTTRVVIPPAALASGTMVAVRVTAATPPASRSPDAPFAVMQFSDLAVHSRVGATESTVWVTGLGDGRPRRGVRVTLHDTLGARVASAVTDGDGFAVLRHPAREVGTRQYGYYGIGYRGYVVAELGRDRAVSPAQDGELAPWRVGAMMASGAQALPMAAAVFVDRGIYRPGEVVHAKAIVRDGPLGALTAPRPGEQVRWLVHRQGDERRAPGPTAPLSDTIVTLSEFGTVERAVPIPTSAPLGWYCVELQRRHAAQWLTLASAGYRVAEFRAPEFRVDVQADSGPYVALDTVRARIVASYLFGAPMRGAAVRWLARSDPIYGWWTPPQGLEGYIVGTAGSWDGGRGASAVVAEATDTLDPRGELAARIPLPASSTGQPTRLTLEATVTDVNRQQIAARTTVRVTPAAFLIAAKPAGKEYFWRAGTPQTVYVLAVRPSGERVVGAAIAAVVERREWRTAGWRSGYAGRWATDTIVRCTLVSAREAVPCTFTPPTGGVYQVSLSARDERGLPVLTAFSRWATGERWAAWQSQSPFAMSIVADRQRYAAGDTAALVVASPFEDADGWLTLEREQLIEQRRVRLRGATTLRIAVTERHAPNVWVSVWAVRRGGPAADTTARVRVGYARLSVAPNAQRLNVRVAPLRAEYEPGDSARLRVEVRDKGGADARAEVTLWAVDEGVLALTGYATPDPTALLYAERGTGFQLASSLTQSFLRALRNRLELERLERQSGVGGGMLREAMESRRVLALRENYLSASTVVTTGQGAEAAAVFRSLFASTAFYLGSVVTDTNGNAIAAAKLPDNLTTFRVMAVAVTAGDRYGSGQSSLLVTRPVLARAALPRFVRPGDALEAGAVINRRAGDAVAVQVRAVARGIELRDSAARVVTLEPGRGREVRFPFRMPVTRGAAAGAGGLRGDDGDSVLVRLSVTDGTNADAVEARLPVRPDYHRRAFTVSGVLLDSASAELRLPPGIDPDRSRVTLSLGTSPLTIMRGMVRELRVYPYHCTEQVASAGLATATLYRVQRTLGLDSLVEAGATREIARAVELVAERQREDGGIGYWRRGDWTTPWLTAYAGTFLLDAKAVGAAVPDSTLARLTAYLERAVSGQVDLPEFAAYTRRDERFRRSQLLAAAEFLSRVGRPNADAERRLLGQASALSFEDRARLALLVARGGGAEQSRALLAPLWRQVSVEGRRAVLDSAAGDAVLFYSRQRPFARLLLATLAVDPRHRLIGPIVETLVQQGRASSRWWWNTQDYAWAVSALAAFEQGRRQTSSRVVTVRADRAPVMRASPGAAPARDSSITLGGLLSAGPGDSSILRLALDATPGAGAIYYYITVDDVPLRQPVRPDYAGLSVERWYERAETGTPTVSAVEGELVRVRLRIRVPRDRQFVVIDDALPAGLEPVDPSLRTTAVFMPPDTVARDDPDDDAWTWRGWYGAWDPYYGWSPFDHREMRDDRVVYSATWLGRGTYTVSYLARATTPGVFVRPTAHGEEMYNPAVYGRSDGGVFTVTARTVGGR